MGAALLGVERGDRGAAGVRALDTVDELLPTTAERA
jgi:hypothetical protein